MIQRIQSLYILLAFFLGLISLFIPWVTYQQSDVTFVFKLFSSDQTVLSAMLTSTMVAIFCAIALGSLISFKNRKRQMMLVKVTMAIALMVISAFAFDHYQNIQALKVDGELSMNYGLPAVFPVINLILLWLANRGVKKDEDLIKSVDRLR
jgi:hypothetical protein